MIVVGKCSPLDFAATQNYIQKLQDCCIDSDVTVVCNSYNAASDPDNIWQKYQETFAKKRVMRHLPSRANNVNVQVLGEVLEQILKKTAAF